MAFNLPDLPYAHDALAGLGMSAETFEFHHDLLQHNQLLPYLRNPFY